MVVYFVLIPLLLSNDDDFGELFRHLPTYVPTTILVIDAFVNLNTGFYRNGSLVVDKFSVYRAYVKQLLLIDLIGITPLIILGIIPE